VRLALAAAACVALVVPVGAGEVRVAVASNFATTAREVGDAFEAETGHRVAFSSGSTGKLYAQIVNGAPFDVLLAADVERPRRLEDGGVAAPGSRFTYAIGRLVLWSPDAPSIEAAMHVLFDVDNARLAIANPEVAPYGAAAREALESLELWDAYRGRAVRGENVAQAFQFVASGAADLGFVADSVLRNAKVDGTPFHVPGDMHRPIVQQGVLLTAARDNLAAVSYVAFLKGEAAALIIARSGYDVPGR